MSCDFRPNKEVEVRSFLFAGCLERAEEQVGLRSCDVSSPGRKENESNWKQKDTFEFEVLRLGP